MIRHRKRSGWRVWATALLLILAVVPRPAATPRPAFAQATITPEAVAAGVAGLDAIVADAMTRTGVPGVAIAVVYRDEGVVLKGYGVRRAGAPDPVDADTVFQLASVSKPIASTVVAAIAGLGYVDWDDPIVDHLPEFAMSDPWVTQQVTLKDMFAHRSGLPKHAGDSLEDLGYDRAEILYRLRFQRPASSFRSGYAYTNYGLTAAGEAAARAIGLSWEDASDRLLYQPLGMRSTSSRFAEYSAARNRAFPHVRIDGRWESRYQRQPDAQSPAGGVSSTVRDLAQWIRLQLGGGSVGGRQIVAAEPLAETHRPQAVSQRVPDPATQRSGFYGLGWNVGYDGEGRVRLGHSGAFALGAGTTVALLPGEDLAVVVLTNGEPIGVAEAISASFLDLVLTGSVQRDYVTFLGEVFAAELAPTYGTAVDYARPPARVTPARPDEAYSALYYNDYYGSAEVEPGTAGLILRLGPRQDPYPLWHWDGDTFLYQPVGENAYGPSAVTFHVGEDGEAAGVTIENLDIDGEGTFLRLGSAG